MAYHFQAVRGMEVRMPMGAVPWALVITTIGPARNPIGIIPVFLLLVAGIAVVMGLLWLAVLAGFVPERMQPAGDRPLPRGGGRGRGDDAVSRRFGRVLWSVHFQAGEDELDVPVWRELMATVDAVYREQPGYVDLLFAATGTDGEAIITSDELRRAAQNVLDLVEANRRGLPLGHAVLTAARRAHQFARQHPYARVQRTVTRRAA